MTIEFADPRWDWTPFAWAGGALGVLLLIVIVAHLFSKYGDPRYHEDNYENGWLGGLWVAFLIAIPVAAAAATIASALIYGGMLGQAKEDALEELGFSKIEWPSDYGDSEAFLAEYEGSLFLGEIVYTHPLKGYAYQIVEYPR